MRFTRRDWMRVHGGGHAYVTRHVLTCDGCDGRELTGRSPADLSTRQAAARWVTAAGGERHYCRSCADLRQLRPEPTQQVLFGGSDGSG